MYEIGRGRRRGRGKMKEKMKRKRKREKEKEKERKRSRQIFNYRVKEWLPSLLVQGKGHGKLNNY